MRIADLRLPIADCRLPTANSKRTGWQHRSASKPTYWLLLSLLVISCLAVHGLSAEPAPASATLLNGTSAGQAVDAVGMTVADMDRSIEFFSNVLTFEKVSDVEVTGSDYERLQGLFGVRMRVVRMRLGNESIELTEYLAPRGRPYNGRPLLLQPGEARGRVEMIRHQPGLVQGKPHVVEQGTDIMAVGEHTARAPDQHPDADRGPTRGLQAHHLRPSLHQLHQALLLPGGQLGLSSPPW